MGERNVIGGELEPCGTDPVTGFHRDGCCRPDAAGRSTHLVCAVVTSEFLEHQASIGNDLVTPMRQFGFPGLTPGDRWCVTAPNWRQAWEDGAASFVVLACTHESALDWVPMDALREHAVDVPADPGALEGVTQAPEADARLRFGLFGWLTALAFVLDELWWNGFEVPSVHFAVVVLCCAVLVRPQATGLVLALFALEAASAARDMPGVGSHTLLVAVCLAAVVAFAGWHVATTRRLATAGELLVRSAPLLRGAVVVLYAAAALAKLNPGFFDPAVSCGAAMSRQITWWHPGLLGGWVRWPATYGAVGTEAALAVLLSVRRTRTVGLAVGVGFHLVLALAGNVPFSAVVFALYVGLLPEGFASRALAPLPRPSVGVSAGLFAALVGAWLIAARLADADPAQARTVIGDVTRGAVVVLVLVGCGLVLRARTGGVARAPRHTGRHPVFAGALALLVLNAASPYIGWKTESAFTMFSNLQTEGRDWNSFVVPRAVRVFGDQSHLVTVTASNDRRLLRRTTAGTRMVRFELERYVRRNPRSWATYVERPGGPRRVVRASAIGFVGAGLLDRVAKFRDVRAVSRRGC